MTTSSPTPLAAVPAPDPEVVRTLGLDRRGKRRRWLRRAGLIIAGAAVLGAAATYLGRPRPAGRPPYVTMPVERGDLVVTVTATGRLEPWTTVNVAPEISGRVARVWVDYNQQVAAGQPLVELDTDLLRAQVEQASAQVQLARANASQAAATRDQAHADLERAQALAGRGVLPSSELDAARASRARADGALAAAEAQLRSAGAALTVARTSLDKAVVRSPIDGVVLSRAVDVGQTVVAALQAPVLFQLAAGLSRLRLVVNVDEADIGRVAEKERATFTVAAYPERTFSAVVIQVRNAAQNRDNVVTFQTVLEVDNRDGALRPGMTGTAAIEAQTEKGALIVPNAALRFRPHGSAPGDGSEGPRVWVLRAGAPVAVPVAPGASDGARTSIRAAGLAAGERVVVSGETRAP